jgi:hypothetical protein
LTYDTRLEENDVVDAQKHHDASFTGHKEGRNDKSTLIVRIAHNTLQRGHLSLVWTVDGLGRLLG